MFAVGRESCLLRIEVLHLNQDGRFIDNRKLVTGSNDKHSRVISQYKYNLIKWYNINSDLLRFYP